MSLCFIEPQNAIRVIAESVGLEARRQLLGEIVRAWVDEMRGEEAFDQGVGEEQWFETVLPWLSDARCRELADDCVSLYCWDRLGSDN